MVALSKQSTFQKLNEKSIISLDTNYPDNSKTRQRSPIVKNASYEMLREEPYNKKALNSTGLSKDLLKQKLLVRDKNAVTTPSQQQAPPVAP